jgi:hypothetical protein
MPRKARIDYPGGIHHLIVLGIERKRIFQDDRDRNAFLDRLGGPAFLPFRGRLLGGRTKATN